MDLQKRGIVLRKFIKIAEQYVVLGWVWFVLGWVWFPVICFVDIEWVLLELRPNSSLIGRSGEEWGGWRHTFDCLNEALVSWRGMNYSYEQEITVMNRRLLSFHIAHCSCKNYNNLNSFFAIVVGLINGAVSRLHQTWKVSFNLLDHTTF